MLVKTLILIWLTTWIQLTEAQLRRVGLPESPLSFPRGYNRNTPPDERTTVWVGFIVRDVSSVSAEDFSITLILETMMGWNDPRVAFNQDVLYNKTVDDRWYFMNQNDYWRLWKPSLLLERMKRRTYLKDRDREHAKNNQYAITKGEDYKLFYSDLTSTTISCAMDFKPFPFDEHVCYYELTSGKTMDEMELRYFNRLGQPTWGVANVTTVLQFELQFADIDDSAKERSKELFSGFQPKVSYAGFQIKLTRIATPYLLNYYLPSGLFVIVSWTSYAIPVRAIPGRVALIMTTFLSLINIANSAFDSSPSNQGINLMQVWIISCIFLVFISVLEYFILLWFERFVARKMRDAKKARILRQRLDKADKHLLRISPVLFLLFCLIYSIAVAHT